MTEKQRGNAFFKNQQYQEAIECYQRYTKENHEDNYRAFGNMALCYKRLKKYKECIDSCEAALELKPEFDKAVYRMYEAYRQLKDYPNMIVMAHKFIKCSDDQKEIDGVQKQTAKVRQLMNQQLWRTKFYSQSQHLLLEALDLQEQEQKQSIASHPKQTWADIEKLILKDRREGINKARKFIIFAEEKQVKGKEQRLAALIQKVKIKETKKLKENQKSDPQDQWVSDDEGQKVESNFESSQKQKTKTVQSNHQKQQSRQKSSSKIKTESETKEQAPKIKYATKPDWQISEEAAKPLIQKYINSALRSRADVFMEFYERISQVADHKQLSSGEKLGILKHARNHVDKFEMMLKAFNAREKIEMEHLFMVNGLMKYKDLSLIYFGKG